MSEKENPFERDDRVLNRQVFIKAAELAAAKAETAMGKLLKYADYVLNLWGIEPENHILGTDLAHLQSGPGIIFANHPGSADLALTLDLLKTILNKRNDLKVLLSEFSLPFYSDHFGSENYLGVGSNPFETTKTFQKILEHLRDGGLFLIFPTGFQGDPKDLDFRPGLAFLLKRLDIEATVCSVSIESNYQRQIDESVTARRNNALAASPEQLEAGQIQDSILRPKVNAIIENQQAWQRVIVENAPHKNYVELAKLITERYVALHANNLPINIV